MTPLTDQQQLNLRIKCAEDAGWELSPPNRSWPNAYWTDPLTKELKTANELPSLTYETLHGVIKRMSYKEKCDFVWVFNRLLPAGNVTINKITAPLPTLALCVAKAKGWEI